MKAKRWSYVVYVQTCHLGDEVRRGVNPFTGEPMEAFVDLSVTPSERGALSKLLKKYDAQENDYGDFGVLFPDGTEMVLVHFSLDPGEIDIVAPKKELSEAVFMFLHQLAKVGNMALRTSGDDAMVLTSPPSDPKMIRRWKKTVIARTPSELKAWFEEKVEGSRCF